MSGWDLPKSAVLQGVTYPISWDYRDILEIFSYFENPDLPEYLRWQIALGLFYPQPLPDAVQQEAIAYLCFFIRGGEPEKTGPARKLIDWQTDAPLIVADINKTLAMEIRALPQLHWWTFLSYFNGIGEGQLSSVLHIRQKLQSGKALEKWEREFYRSNKQRIDLPKRYSRQELEEIARVQQLLDSNEK